VPIYSFQNPKTKEVKDIWLSMKSERKYIDEDGLEWTRVYSVPYLGMDTRIDPYSKNAFIEKTKRKGTFGDLFDLSKEMSEKRGGSKNDPIKRDFSKKWHEQRGKKPPGTL